jgi:type I restriction enzyme M protein
MVTGEIKNQIDQIWDALYTGGVTNSITVLDQLTYLFFMKMLDDDQIKKEKIAAQLGIKTISNAVFREGNWHNPETEKDVPYQSLRWSYFKNIDAKQMFNTVRMDAFAFIKNIGTDVNSAYSRYMSNAVFMVPTERVLDKVVQGIDNLDMNNRDTMGDVYEYILGKMAESGTNGQFRTPRHIIRMMVEMMKPTLDDTICDPAMGSAGFLVESARYVKEHQRDALLKVENMQHYRNGMFNGFDTDQTMLRIGSMNMMLHGVDNPNIEYRDSLSTENTDADRYTLCLANPPFSGSLDYEVTNPNLLAVTKTKQTELLFIALFRRMLQTGGRCASIVPDGVLFGNSKGHKALRREIVDGQCLHAIISMPSGVFQPYSGVSTAIMVFTKTNSGGTDKVWFYDMHADGYTLNATRTACDDNDIPDVVNRYQHLADEAGRTRKDQSFLVPVDEIRANDYDLSINKYKEVERVKVEYEKPEVLLSEAEQLIDEVQNAIGDLKKMME